MLISHTILLFCLCSISISDSSNNLINITYGLSEYPRIIWSYYVGTMPPYVREMMDTTVDKVNKTWKYNFLTNENISDYFNISSFPSYFSLLLPQHQSDIIRLILLYKYGGWWMDSAIIINDETEIERIYNKIIENKTEFYATCVYECPLKDVENNFMYAKKGSVVIKRWLEEMDKVYKMGQKNYIYEIYREGVNIPRITFTKYPTVNPYMVSFVAFEKAIFRTIPRNVSIIIEPSDDVLYTMHRYVRENKRKYKDVYFNEELRKQFPIIKLGGWLRVILFKEKRISGFESYEPFPLQEGSKGGKEIGKKMIKYLIRFSLINFMLISLMHYEYLK